MATVVALAATALTNGLALARPAPAVPLDPIDTIVAAFADHDVVALGEGNHGNLPGHQLRMQLLRDRRFREQVRDIVVEFGNSLHQDVADRYVRGEDVDPSDLRKVWQDTAQANPVWESPVYEEFFHAVREANTGLPEEKQLRVVLGDVPFDWSGINTLEDYNRQPKRDDAVSAEIVRSQVLARGRKALIVFGDLHLLRQPLLLEPRESEGEHAHIVAPERSIVAHLEEAGASVFSIYGNTFLDMSTLQPEVARWQSPKLALLAGTQLGEVPFATYQSPPTILEGKWYNVDAVHSPTMTQEFDAVLFLGAPSTIAYASPPASLCRNQRYLDMRFFRMNLVGWGAEVEQIKRFCSAVTGPAPQQ